MLKIAGIAAGLILSLPTSLASAAEIPINIGVGPSYFLIPETLQEEQQPFYGLHLEINAVIDRDTIKRNKGKIPPAYQKAVDRLDEVRVGFLLIPDSIMIAPRTEDHGLELFGATWRPLAVGIPIGLGPVRLSLDTGLLFTYAFINIGDFKILDDETADEDQNPAEPKFVNQVTHFLRPGGDIRGEIEVKFSDNFLTSLGWSSAYYVPQKIGGGIGDVGERLDRSIWRIHQAFLVFHYRFPVHVSM